MLTKSVVAASLTDDVARLTLANVIGLEAGYTVRVAGVGQHYDGHHELTAVDTTELWVEFDKNHNGDIPEADVTGLLEVIVTWADDAAVIGFLGVDPASEADADYLTSCTEAANTWVYMRRAKSGYVDLPNAVPGSDVKLGVVLYAGALYRERGSVDSFASFQDMPTIAPVGTMGQIMRLIACNRPRVH